MRPESLSRLLLHLFALTRAKIFSDDESALIQNEIKNILYRTEVAGKAEERGENRAL